MQSMVIELSTKNRFDVAAIHADSIQKLLRKGAMHLRNEVATAVQGKIERDERSQIKRKTAKEAGDTTEVKKAKLEAFRNAFGADVDKWYDEIETALIADLVSGAFAAEREAGSGKRLTELEFEVRGLAKIELEAKLGQKPKNNDVLNVNGKDMTYDDLIEAYVGGQHKARLEGDAQKAISARKARADRAGKAAAGKTEGGGIALDI